MKYSYRTSGTCSSQIDLEVEDGIVQDGCFTGGCNGKREGIFGLVKGMQVEEVISRLDGISC